MPALAKCVSDLLVERRGTQLSRQEATRHPIGIDPATLPHAREEALLRLLVRDGAPANRSFCRLLRRSLIWNSTPIFRTGHHGFLYGLPSSPMKRDPFGRAS